jgi:hypothetical protein
MKKLTMLWCFSFLILAQCLLGLPSSSIAGTKWALLIGVDEYKSKTVPDLKGCINDVRLMENLFIERFGFPKENVKTLLGMEATHQGIVTAIQQHLIANVTAGDIVVLHFSGHGSQLRDEIEGDEIDGWDETIVPYDSRQDGIFDITDDQLNGLLTALTSKTDHVIFFLDSCHSGSAVRGGATVREIKRDNRPPPAVPKYAVSSKESVNEGIRVNGSKYVLISGCLPHEMSNESEYEGRYHGALSWYLFKNLMAAKTSSTYRSLLEDTAAAVTSDFFSQHPQIEGPGQNVELFGTNEFSPQYFARIVEVRGNRVFLSAGKTQLVGRGAILGVYPPGTIDYEHTELIAKLEIITADDFESQAKIVSGGGVLVGSKALLIEPSYSTEPIPFYVEPLILNKLPHLLSFVNEIQSLKVLEENEKTSARLILSKTDGYVSLQGGDLKNKFPPVSMEDEDLSSRIENQIKQTAHWMNLKGLLNRATDAAKVTLSLRRKRDPTHFASPYEVSPNEHLIIRATNSNKYPLFLYILDISSDGSVALLYSSGSEPLLPDSSKDLVEINTFVPPGFSWVSDTFKIIATSEQINPMVFPQGLIRDVALKRPSLSCDNASESNITTIKTTPKKCNPLQDFLSMVASGQRGSTVVPSDSWGTDEQTIRISKPNITSPGFTLHMDKSVAPDTFIHTTRKICNGVDDNSCFDAIYVNKQGTEWGLIKRGVKRGNTPSAQSIGAVFDEAYNLLDTVAGSFRVEPLFEVPMAQTEIFTKVVHADGRKRSFSAEKHEPLARDDERWSLKMIRAEEAWELLRQKNGAKVGAEAQGILIAHIDTGYRQHPEVWTEYLGERPIRPDLGHDYFTGEPDPWDPLLNSNVLDNPGHATASGSVIVSPPGCQVPDPDGCVTGVAPGAQLIPLRVHRTVTQINTHNMVKAIRDVASGRIDGKPKLISIAMGGPPTLSLKKAVDKATENGVLIVAAAGNNVKTVVWPARFKNTIAVAAVNVLCQPWSGSSAGSRIDVSAPGQDVWRASMFESDGSILPPADNGSQYKNAPTYDIWMGNGTTYATGHTSGAAALWLSFHKNDTQFQAIADNGQIVSVFRNALTASAWQPSSNNPYGTHCETSAGWDSDLYGEGILDAASLLEAPLRVTQTTQGESELLPLFGSLYSNEIDSERIESDFYGIFGKPVPHDKKRGGIDRFETELMHHYTLDAEVRRSIDSLTSPHREIDPYTNIKSALLKKDISSQLREAL